MMNLCSSRMQLDCRYPIDSHSTCSLIVALAKKCQAKKLPHDKITYQEAHIVVSGNHPNDVRKTFSAENNQSSHAMGIGEGRGIEATYLHGKDAGRGVGHGGKALDAGEGRGGNSEHGELHG